MTPDEVMTLSRYVLKYWTRPELDDEGVAAFMIGLADLPYGETAEALRLLQRTERFRPPVSTIRRTVAGRLGLLPPSTESAVHIAMAWVDAREQRAFANGTGYDPPPPPPLHPVIEKVVRSLDTSHPSWLAQFRREYRDVASAEVRRVVGTDFDKLSIGDGRG